MKLKDLTGQKFGKLTVIEMLEERDAHRRVVFRCRCECGNECVVPGYYLTGRGKTSCGCDKAERIRASIRARQAKQREIPQTGRCKGCIHRRFLTGTATTACHYCWDTGKLRNCPVEECPYYCNDRKKLKEILRKEKEAK